jgi:hypothetical protein
MADICAELARLRQTDLCIQVGTIEIDLPAMAMNDVAERADLLLEHAMSRGISHHHRREVFRMCLGLGFEVGHVDIASGIAGDDNNVHANHICGRRVGAMRR